MEDIANIHLKSAETVLNKRYDLSDLTDKEKTMFYYLFAIGGTGSVCIDDNFRNPFNELLAKCKVKLI